MLTALAFILLPQRLDPPRDVAYPGDPVVVQAIDSAGAPLVGVSVQVVTPTGKVAALTSDSSGKIVFTPAEAGRFELRMQVLNGPQVISVYRVVARPRRWIYALVLTPLGLLLIYVNLRRFQR